MWSWRRRDKSSSAGAAVALPPASCPVCADGQVHCHGTLVLHADGVLDCHQAVCGADPSLHRSWVTCVELESPCGCVGDEHPSGLLAEAA